MIPEELKDKEFMQDLLNEDCNDAIIIEDTIDETSRWSEHHSLIFKYKGELYSTYYSRGLTEQQDESPWEYDEPEVSRCKAVQKTITSYEVIK